ncbi:hypothetical protein ASPZODRAFT_18676 [Penicilliopsis zonata CBS 506.65]|uniref:Major facilitator superfamily (MFS) profile domain-containing protein n=1 Tax=Penicilliopsis zonata CBS 506.65 TaxID=1073090 RepID=A0A1L9SBH2_9EURO|nr:hypothetical protein ASPZODRAFT_18676 [Penicilliopsis zonata CBS 506.65]OJJ44486.1 hypothetical protein ASPZODRAFT_18676 [Penicilliopsis zonata CBS 506.65]
MTVSAAEAVDRVPGTVRLVDFGHQLHNVKHQTGKSDVVLIPQPTSNPNDPLNWSKARKEYHFWLLWIWGFIAAVSVNWSGPVWTQLADDLHTDYVHLNISSALCWLFLGIGCVLLQPTSMKIGRRPVYILGTLFNIAGCICGGLMHTVKQYFAVNILTGFGAAPVDSLVEISTTDLFFLHERGTRLSLYIFAIYAGSYLGPVASGYIAASQDWRWCFWYLVIFFAVLLLVQILSLEESSFRRPAQPLLGEDVAAAKTINYDDEEAAAAAAAAAATVYENEEERQGETDSDSPPVKTFTQRLRLWDVSQNDPRSWLLLAIQPFSLLVFPPIVWAGVVYGVQVMWLSLLASTQSLIFNAAPYNFSVEVVGDTNFAAFIGGSLGMLWGGSLSDWYTQRLARRNNGIMEPEFRLWMMLPLAIINTAGVLMYGVGAAQGAHWIVPAGFGTAFIGFGIGSGGAIAITYAVDCYPEVASESLVLMLFLRNMVGTGFTFAIQPWLDLDGLQTTSIIMAVLCLVFNLSFVIFTWKGKSMRRWTAKRYWSMAERSRAVHAAVI